MVGVDHYAAESVISVIANFGAELKFNDQIIHSGRSDTMSKQDGGCCAKSRMEVFIQVMASDSRGIKKDHWFCPRRIVHGIQSLFSARLLG
jgi:hypothetical protein